MIPRNPLLAYMDQKIAAAAHGKDNNTPVLFYINPSNKGAVVGRREVDYFVKRSESITREIVTAPCPDKLIIRKLMDTLILSYEELGYQDKVDDLRDIVSML